MLDRKRYVILDFETTHFNPEQGEIWEVAAIEMDGLVKLREYHSLVSISAPLPPSSLRLSKVDDSILLGAPDLPTVQLQLIEFINELPIVAQNSRFERDWYRYYIANREQFYDSTELFGLILSHLPSHSEDNLRKFFGIQNSNAHRALEDCRDLADILNETHKFLIHERPEIITIYNMFLRESHWFWSWFFMSGEGRDLKAVLSAQAEGDLRSFVQDDLKYNGRTLAESNASNVAQIFRAAIGEKKSIRERPQQIKMALETNSALESKERISIEAPTGTGKSLAYLVPASLNALSTSLPVVVSTHTKELQNQIISKDRIRLNELLGEEIKMSLVKGQNNYFCLRKLFERGDFILSDPDSRGLDVRWPIAYLYSLALSSSSAEVPERSRYSDIYPELTNLLSNIRSHKDTTIGLFCPHHSYCRFFNSARLAHKSNIIVANHSLVFSWPNSLPKIRKVVFDEAHHLENEITRAFTNRISLVEIRDCFSSLISIKKTQTRGLFVKLHSSISDERDVATASLDRLWKQILAFNEFSSQFEELNLLIPKIVEDHEIGPFGLSIDLSGVKSDEFWTNFREFSNQLKSYHEYFRRVFEWLRDRSSPSRMLSEISAEISRLERFASVFSTTSAGASPNLYNAFEFTECGNWSLASVPVRIKDHANTHFGQFHSVIMTSATLSIPGKPGFVANELGLNLTRQPILLASEYKLNDQAEIFFPRGLNAKPGDPAHLSALIDFTEAAVKLVGGRTLLLMCSTNRKNQVVQELKQRLGPLGIDVVERVEHFKDKPSKCLLVGLEKFGEGLDIPGQDLSCVIVEKINEAMTMKPIAQKRSENPATNGGSSFVYNFARRLIWLKQRVGRLVRTETDRGWIIIFDTRFERWTVNSRKFFQDGLAPIPIRALPVDLILGEMAKTRDQILKDEKDDVG